MTCVVGSSHRAQVSRLILAHIKLQVCCFVRLCMDYLASVWFSDEQANTEKPEIWTYQIIVRYWWVSDCFGFCIWSICLKLMWQCATCLLRLLHLSALCALCAFKLDFIMTARTLELSAHRQNDGQCVMCLHTVGNQPNVLYLYVLQVLVWRNIWLKLKKSKKVIANFSPTYWTIWSIVSNKDTLCSLCKLYTYCFSFYFLHFRLQI